MSGGTVAAAIGGITAAGVGSAIAGGVISTAVGVGAKALIGGGSSSGGGSGGGSSGGLNISQSQYAYYGPHPSTTPLSGQQAPKPQELTAPKAGKAEAATAGNLRSTPTQGVGEEQAKQDYNDIWADRLSHYLDYNTRALG